MATKLWIGGTSGATTSYSTAANWSSSGVPNHSDNVVIARNNQATLYDITDGLDQSAVDLASFTVAHSYTGKIGAATAYLQIRSADVTIGEKAGLQDETGPTRIKLDLGDAEAATVNVIDTASSSSDTGSSALQLIGGSTYTHTINVLGGNVGLCSMDASEAGKFDLFVPESSQGSTPHVIIGRGATLVLCEIARGLAIDQGHSGDVSQLRISGGELRCYRAAAYTNIDLIGNAKLIWNSTDTLTTVNVGSGTEMDCSGDPRAKTITSLKLHSGSKYNGNTGKADSVTYTNDIKLVKCRLSDVSVDRGLDTDLKFDYE